MIEQRSEEWFQARIGKITGSVVKDLMPSEKAKKPWTEGQLTIIRKLAAERLTGCREESFTSSAMQWGIDHEEEALGLLELYLDKVIGECSFVEIDKYSGASPDGETDDAVIEVKCPSSKQHLLYYLDKQTLFDDYKWQVYMEMWATKKDKAYLCSYDPRFKPGKQIVVYKVTLDNEIMDKLQQRVKEANKLIEDMCI